MANWIETILGAACGETVKVTPEYVVLNDGPSHKAIEGVEHVAHPERVVIYYDHDVPSGAPETSRIFAELLAFSRKHGVKLVQSEGVGTRSSA